MKPYKEEYSPELCGDCVYFVDWFKCPGTTGESMARQGFKRYGCMRYMALINGKVLKPCRLEEIRERQLVLSL